MTIKKYLEKTSMRHCVFAEKCGIQKSAFSRYVNGSRTPDLMTYLKIKKNSKGMITEFDHIMIDLPKFTEFQ